MVGVAHGETAVAKGCGEVKSHRDVEVHGPARRGNQHQTIANQVAAAFDHAASAQVIDPSGVS